MMFPFTLGAACALLAYLAAVLFARGVQLERANRYWRLLDQRQPFYLDALSDFTTDPLIDSLPLAALDAPVRTPAPNLTARDA